MEARAAVLDAVQKGHADRLRDLLAGDPALAATRNDADVSVLLLCRYQQRSDLVELVLAAGPPMDVFDAAAFERLERLDAHLAEDPGATQTVAGDGFTALHLACYFGKAEATKRLLAAGADADAVAANGTALRPLHSAAASRRADVVQALLDHGVDVNAKQALGWTALHAAAQHGDVEMARALLAAGADPSMANDEGTTPVDLARAAEHAEIVELLP